VIFLLALAKSLGLLVFVLLNALFLVWAERKILGHIQVRLGPMRVGRHGLLQTVADALKLFLKEDIIPLRADRRLFVVAPFIVFIPAFIVYVVIPFSDKLITKDLDIGIFYVFAVAALFPIGILLAGWASDNKYSLLGGMRAAAQQISYEVPMLLSVLGVVMVAGTMSTVGIVEAQRGIWFLALQPLGFLIYAITMIAELNRTPFDMPEAESELVAGFHVEYSGMRWALFMLSEYSNMFLVSALATTLFLGGWKGPFLPPLVWFLIKTYFLVFVIIWVRGTLPRIRVDQLMDLGWKALLPLSLVNIGATGLYLIVWGTK
jgi:NADH-quinone oxidoreductase subunit H